MVKQIRGSCAIPVNALALNNTLLNIRDVEVEEQAPASPPRSWCRAVTACGPALSRSTLVTAKGFSPGCGAMGPSPPRAACLCARGPLGRRPPAGPAYLRVTSSAPGLALHPWRCQVQTKMECIKTLSDSWYKSTQIPVFFMNTV